MSAVARRVAGRVAERVAERALAAAAALVLPVAARLLPLRTTLAICDRWPSHPARGPRYPAAALAGRVRRWMRRGRGPWADTCLTRALVLYAMLRQHGHHPRLHVGVAGSARCFTAHAWVSVDGRPVGEPPDALDGYRELLVHAA